MCPVIVPNSLYRFISLLMNNSVIDISQWRHLQYLGDIRNLCDHDKSSEPAKENLDDLIAGAKKVLKTVY